MDSFVLTALCIPCIIIACCQGGRKEERRERGGNCAERKATADPSVRLNALEAQRGREQCLILRGVGLVLDLFFLFFFWSIIDEKNPHLDQYYQISFSGALSLALKSIFFFFSKSCHVWDYACDGLSHHPPLAHTLLPLRLCRSDTEAGRKVTKVALPFICLCIWHCHREHLILLFTGPAAACWTDGLEEWHRLCLKGRPWSTCSSGTAGLTGSGDLLSVRAERKRSFSRSGPSGLTGTFYTCIAVTLISGGCLGDWWSLFRRTDEICPNLHW